MVSVGSRPEKDEVLPGPGLVVVSTTCSPAAPLEHEATVLRSLSLEHEAPHEAAPAPECLPGALELWRIQGVRGARIGVRRDLCLGFGVGGLSTTVAAHGGKQAPLHSRALPAFSFCTLTSVQLLSWLHSSDF